MRFHQWLFKRLAKVNETVLPDIWIPVLVFALVSVVVTTVSKFTSVQLVFSNQLMTVLGTALGFVISFRTSTAYERWAEGRLHWTNIAMTARTLAQIIWIQVPLKRKSPSDPAGVTAVDDQTKAESPMGETPVEVYVEKKTIINLVIAYTASVKHLLRGEGGVYYKDLYPLVAFLPRFASRPDHATEEDILPLWKASNMDFGTYKRLHQENFSSATLRHVARTHSEPRPDTKEVSESEQETQSLPEIEKWNRKLDPESAFPQIPADQALRPSKDVPAGFWKHYVVPSFKRVLQPRTKMADHQTSDRSKRTLFGTKINHKTDSNVPMEIALVLLSYQQWLLEEKHVSEGVAMNMYSQIIALQNSVVHLERIKNTPLPFAYQAHLRVSVWLYLFFLPCQIYPAFALSGGVWLTIPATVFSAFVMLGLLEIGREIENPFNYDNTDHDLDQFCYAIQRELHEITAHTNPSPRSYMFGLWNQPFAPADRRSAWNIVHDPSLPYHDETAIRRTMLNCWEQVDQMTRASQE